MRRLDRRARRDGGGCVWAIPVIFVTAIVARILLQLLPGRAGQPPATDRRAAGFALTLVAGVDRRADRRGDPVPGVRDDGLGRAGWATVERLVRGALFFAFAHVLTISGATAGEAFGLAVVGVRARVPVAFALGWLFLRRGTIWARSGSTRRSTASCWSLAEIARARRGSTLRPRAGESRCNRR